ncbi:hypothetical protein AXF42_Ash014479 [Apostasia shenzhenica]|uniref:Uncharacterized protein n=1 Tax=Apostasia shenzhenica TaxID=1088818 RepID=A0A2H9ZWQ6_9ASPA|nr:hypothetical protein AXF42_Ash014479 [Apostasia shenzhenica]
MASVGRFLLPHAALLLFLLLLLRSSAPMTNPASSIRPRNLPLRLASFEIGRLAMDLATHDFNAHYRGVDEVLTDTILVMCLEMVQTEDTESPIIWFVVKFLAKQGRVFRVDRLLDRWVLAHFIISLPNVMAMNSVKREVYPFLPFPEFTFNPQ